MYKFIGSRNHAETAIMFFNSDISKDLKYLCVIVHNFVLNKSLKIYQYHASVITFYKWIRIIFFYFILLQDGMTALIAASEGGHTETVKCLIDANTQIDLQHEAST